MQIKRLIIYLFLALALSVCTTPPPAITPSSSILVYNVRSSTVFSGGDLCTLFIQNIKTRAEYQTDLFKKDCGYFFNIPPGAYRITRIHVPYTGDAFVVDQPALFKEFLLNASQVKFLGTWYIHIRVRTPLARLELERKQEMDQPQLQKLKDVKFLTEYSLPLADNIPNIFRSNAVYDLQAEKLPDHTRRPEI
jgi:hypothetical protein